ncbi:TonB-dependent receptor [Fulvitalea axinellae]|uniref:TonB-dependent receptor n=2 Tax=Fulvitalea axinellae TaxID=1182444 RepID=A0AAU9CLN4_9BACT|nr:TonB-dependent receptor [Fulvitalea axinellae]
MLCGMANAFAQYQVKGRVASKTNGQALPSASLLLRATDNKGIGTVTDDQGAFDFKDIKSGEYRLTVSYVGYKTYELDLVVKSNLTLDVLLEDDQIVTETLIVQATRVSDDMPMTKTNLSAKDIEATNLGQDLTYLLEATPSVVATSDAGAGIGYSGIRIRGISSQQINVTVNGIPLNDSESHSVYWVNLPDFASSVENIQIQRGVGTSTNGSAAFGASVNVLTEGSRKEAYAETSNSFGSFNTVKNTVKFGTGLINDRFAVDARLSKITSDGYIDRAESDLKSLNLTASYFGENQWLKFVLLTGKEKTYQAWYGIDQWSMDNLGRTYNYAGAIENDEGEIVDFYDNQTDNYQQDHYQLHYGWELNPELKFNASLHYTYGRGYYEEYKNDATLADYGIAPFSKGTELVEESDLVRQKWLDNDFYGAVFAVQYTPKSNVDLTFGGGADRYDGDHFGKVIWLEKSNGTDLGKKYYDNTGEKTDANLYAKANVSFGALNLYGDLQVRRIDYDYEGSDDDGNQLDGSHDFTFFNPKVGAVYNVNSNVSVYGSFAIGHREPLRDDFIESENVEAERLNNVETGVRANFGDWRIEATGYYMGYKNQFVLTGEKNDVGDFIRVNSGESYRAGLELISTWNITDKLRWVANATWSRNRNKEYKETKDVDGEKKLIVYEDTEISYSPSLVAGSIIDWTPVKFLQLGLNSKYVGEQFYTNTENEDYKLDSYLINDLRMRLKFEPKFAKEISIDFMVRNAFDVDYISNASLWGFFPQAGRNYMVGLNLKF